MNTVLVVGGGPVGLAAAIEARLAGHDVRLIEPRTGAIDKACGEGLMPGALPMLERLGVSVTGHPLTGVRYTDGSRSVDHDFRGGGGLGVRRTALHDALSRRADALGVTRIDGRVDALAQVGDRVAVSGPGVEVSGDWLLACDGLHSTVRRLARLELPARGLARYGLRRHARIAPWSSRIEVHWTPRCEIYITPVADDTVGIAMLGPKGMRFDDELGAVPELRHLLAAPRASELRGAGPLRQRTSARTSGRVLLVGDASGYVDAITGEGLRLGLAQVRSAVAAVSAGAAASYESAWRADTRDFRMLTAGLVAAAGSRVRRAIVPAAVRMPRLYGSVVERLAR